MNSKQHLLSISTLARTQIEKMITLAEVYLAEGYHRSRQLDHLKKFTVVTAFFEASTRTRVSFELAAQRTGAAVINLPIEASAVKKGETLRDTITHLQAMGCQFFVIRHSEDRCLEAIQDLPDVSLINAGTGSYAHPSQALLDVLTMKRAKKNLTDLSIAIIGDIKHSRVVASQLALYKKLGIKDVRLIAPPPWLPPHSDYSTTDNLAQGIADCDVVNVFRIQHERITSSAQVDLKEYCEQFQLTPKYLSLAKPDAIILHPGPVNREIEIAEALIDCPQSRIKQQVTNGVAMRMAIFSCLAESY
jgi:aspartate carbamoyltransferase catalytic subunit